MDEAYRLNFAYDGDAFELKSMQRVAMRVPPGGAAPPADLVGHFVELRDGEGEPLYRRPIAPPRARALEYPTGDPDRPLGRAEAPGPVMMSVLVPAEPAGRSVALVEAAAGASAEFAADAVPARRDLVVVDLPEAKEAG